MSNIIESSAELIVRSLDLHRAKSAFATANIPEYFLHSLKSDECISEVNSKLTVQETYDLIRLISQKKPDSLEDLILPYVLLVSLSEKAEYGLIEEAGNGDYPHHPWMHHFSKILSNEYTPRKEFHFDLTQKHKPFVKNTNVYS
ncbi:hypothetical protein [Thalassospira xiamenensis]|uniref:hypothetical protein n=1 Tax=Thalassospira xiamenensis TaxID=220697 RepID=UPI0011BDF3AE|nr:hypothetical protein [Thalassospira xiamenensis]